MPEPIDLTDLAKMFSGTAQEKAILIRESKLESKLPRHYYSVHANGNVFCYACLIDELHMIVSMAQRVSTNIEITSLKVKGFAGHDLYATTAIL